jgi:type I restriction enzyme S subunit
MLQNFPVALPPLADQAVIARYLDYVDRRVRRYVGAKERLIGLLEEEKQAIINQAVTRGLNPGVRLKASGVEWLGDVPEHWEVLKPPMGFSLIGSGTTPRSDSDEYYDGDTPWVTTSELREQTIFETVKSISEMALREHPTLKLYPKGALVIAMYGATIGRLGILGVPAAVNQACCVFAAETRLRARFVYFWLMAFRDVLVSRSAGGGQPNLSQEDLRDLRIPAPPIPEQDRIVNHLKTKDAALRRLIAEVESAVERLQEHRTALVTAAVTGKIDVREQAALGTTEIRAVHKC